MKNPVLILVILLACHHTAAGQCQRKPLLEKFTSETCPPDLATNAAFKIVADSNKGKVAIIAWHTPIPSASSNTDCPYRQNKTENDWRYRGTPMGYGYQSQNTASATPANGINSSPTSRMDGQHLWAFGAPSDHTYYFQTNYLNNARAITSPFCLLLNAAWNASYTAMTVSVNITATQNFTASGSLRFRLVMTEELHYLTPPGTNTEKDFYNVARASFPNLMSGTLLDTVWQNGDSHSFIITCPIPSTIVNKALLNMVGFVQDDGNKKVLQAEETPRIPFPNDIALAQLMTVPMQCDTMLLSTVTLSNAGTNTISTFILSTQVDNYPVSSSVYSLTITPGSSVSVQPPLVVAPPGPHMYSVNVDNPNGQSDWNDVNNSAVRPFQIFSPPNTVRVLESFNGPAFPPPGWQINNGSFSTGWRRESWPGGYAADTGCARYPFYNAWEPGRSGVLYLPPFSLASSTKHSISFDVAYAQYSASTTDTLKLEVSEDCGLTWSTVSSKSGSLLATASPSTTPFRPDASQWRTEKFNLIALSGKPYLIMRFVAVSDFGNDLFLDNINLETTTGINEFGSSTDMLLYPNPASEKLSIEFLQSSGRTMRVEISTITGQVLYSSYTSTSFSVLQINTSTWPGGMYLVRAEDGDRSFVGRVAVSR